MSQTARASKLATTAAAGALAVGATACQPEGDASFSCVDGTVGNSEFTVYLNANKSGFALEHRSGKDALRAAGAFHGVEKDLLGNETPQVGFVEGAEVLAGESTGLNTLGKYDDEQLTKVTVSVGPNDDVKDFVIDPASAEMYSCEFPPPAGGSPSNAAHQGWGSRPATMRM